VVEEMGFGLSDQVAQAVDRAVDVVLETAAELIAEAALAQS
jgi:Ni,Fe-hydrogenase maturation factor